MNKFTARLRRASPAIMTCISIVGVIGTTTMAVRATPKALRLIKAKKDELKADKLTPMELVQTTWQCYIPSALIGTGTIACIIGIGVMGRRNRAVLTSAYAMLNESYKQYRQAAKRVYGGDADSKIHAEMAKDAYVHTSDWGYQVYNLDMDLESERVLCYDMISRRYFNTTMAAVINAQYHINRNLQLRGYCSVNEYYDFLGIEGIKYGDEMGWCLEDMFVDGFAWLDFDNRKTVLEDGLECYILSTFDPTKFDGELDI